MHPAVAKTVMTISQAWADHSETLAKNDLFWVIYLPFMHSVFSFSKTLTYAYDEREKKVIIVHKQIKLSSTILKTFQYI